MEGGGLRFVVVGTVFTLTCTGILLIPFWLDRTNPPGGIASSFSPEIRHELRLLLHGDEQEQLSAQQRLVVLGAEFAFVECLKSPNPTVAFLGEDGLRECWKNEEGAAARLELDEGMRLLDRGRLEEGEIKLRQLVAAYPRWAEALNQHAIALYLLGEFEQSIDLCEIVVLLKPHHMGAWQGLALNAAALRDWDSIERAGRAMERIQPSQDHSERLRAFAQTNRNLL
jgi:tetratricopeptide (TPR) repeat protein